MIGQLRDFLLADPAIAGLIGTRCYPQVAPQDAAYPLLRILTVSTRSEQGMRGATGLAVSLIQIDAYSKQDVQARDLAEKVRIRLQGFSGTWATPAAVVIPAVLLDDSRDTYDEDLELYGKSADYRIWHEEPVPGA